MFYCGAREEWVNHHWLKQFMHKLIPKNLTNNLVKPLKLIEIHREDIQSLPGLLKLLRGKTYRFLLFCDDLSFDHDDNQLQIFESYT